MLRVNEYRFYALGQRLGALKPFTHETTNGDAFFQLWDAREALKQLLLDPMEMKVCRPAAQKLVSAISYVVPDNFQEALQKLVQQNGDQPIGWQIGVIQKSLNEFEPVLAAECETVDTYAVSRKGIYATNELVDRAEGMFSTAIRKLLGEQTIRDLRQAGRCLAFDLDTACGFHLVRATETVIHEYYVAVTGHTPKRKDRNWGAYVRNLNAHRNKVQGSKADPKLISLIDQIREHHRNVVIHPEESLNAEEAMSLFGICQSAITSLANGLRAVRAASTPAP